MNDQPSGRAAGIVMIIIILAITIICIISTAYSVVDYFNQVWGPF
jgi:hypothetical protein